MTIFDKLKNIFEGKFKDVFKDNKFAIFDFSKNNTYVIEPKGTNILSIDLSKAVPEEKKQIKEVIDYSIQKDQEALLNSRSHELTERIHKNLPRNADIELLEFYKGKLVPEMYNALEGALIVKRIAENKEDFTLLKTKIARQYPRFGNNLCNMVSQGYFHGHFKELYVSMASEPDFDIERYSNKVLKIVESSPYTVFTTRYKTYDEMSGEVRFKLEKLKKYGTGKLVIHGLSKENVETIKCILEEYKDDNSVQIEVDPDSTSKMITAHLKF